MGSFCVAQCMCVKSFLSRRRIFYQFNLLSFFYIFLKSTKLRILDNYEMKGNTQQIDVCLKEIRCEQSILQNPDGSADYSDGDTNVLVAVYGPADCRESRQLIDRCAIEVSFRPKDGIPGVAEKFLENTIRNICETVIMTKLHPRSQITVVVQVIQDHGSLLSCAINGVSMALQDAGVSMTCLPAAVSMALTQKDREEKNPHLGKVERAEEIVMSPSRTEEENATSSMLFVIDSVRKDVISTQCNGSLPAHMYKNCLSAARTASEDIFKFYRESVSKKVRAATGIAD